MSDFQQAVEAAKDEMNGEMEAWNNARRTGSFDEYWRTSDIREIVMARYILSLPTATT